MTNQPYNRLFVAVASLPQRIRGHQLALCQQPACVSFTRSLARLSAWSVLRTWVTALLIVFVSAVFAQNALPSLSNGTELIITDEASEVILGYGTVNGGRLELNLSDTRATMVVLFISPNGSFTTLRGYLGEDKRLWLTDEATQELTNLESLSRTADIALRVSGVAVDAFVAGSDDDDRLRPPDQLAQPAARPASSSREAASSRLGIDLADGDDDDDNNQTSVSRNPDVSNPDVSTPEVGSSDSPNPPEAPATPSEPAEGDDSDDETENGAEGDAEDGADGDTAEDDEDNAEDDDSSGEQDEGGGEGGGEGDSD